MKRAYTRRSKVKSKSYIKAIPLSKIAKFSMGDAAGAAKYPCVVDLVMLEPIQLRDNSVEAARQQVHRHLDEKLKGNFYFIVSAYPHHILRENKMLTGAGADRMSTGMQRSFGKPVGIAAQIHAGGKVFSIACMKEAVPFVRSTLEKIRPKIPGVKAIKVSERKQSS